MTESKSLSCCGFTPRKLERCAQSGGGALDRMDSPNWKHRNQDELRALKRDLGGITAWAEKREKELEDDMAFNAARTVTMMSRSHMDDAIASARLKHRLSSSPHRHSRPATSPPPASYYSPPRGRSASPPHSRSRSPHRAVSPQVPVTDTACLLQCPDAEPNTPGDRNATA
jgi:hypothetical protein